MSESFRNRLFTRTTAGIAAVALLVLVIVLFSLRSQRKFDDVVTGQAHGQLMTLARSISTSLREHIELLSHTLGIISSNRSVQKIMSDWDPDHPFFPSSLPESIYQAHNHHAEALYLLDRRGTLIARYPAKEEMEPGSVSLAGRPDVADVLGTKLPTLSEPFLSQKGDLVISVSEPVFDRTSGGEFVGIARWIFKVGSISELYVNGVRAGETGYAQVVDGNGRLIAGPEAGLIGRPFREAPRSLFPDHDWTSFDQLVEQAMAGGEGTGALDMAAPGPDGGKNEVRRRLAAYTPVRFGGTTWSVIMSMDHEEAARPIVAGSRESLLFTAAIVAIIAAAGWQVLRMQRRLAAQQSEKQLVSFLDSLPFGIFVLTAGGKPYYANHEAERILGNGNGSGSRADLLSLFSDTYLAGTGDRYPRERMPVVQAMAGTRSSASDIELRKDGKAVLLEMHGVPITAESGGLRYVIGAFQDITERARMQAGIVQAKQDWEDTFNLISDLITVHDANFGIVAANKAARETLGLAEMTADVTPKCFTHYHGTGVPPRECPTCACRESNVEITTERFEPHLNRFMEFRAIPRIDHKGKQTGFIHVVRDISDRKRLEDELKHRALYDSLTKLPNRMLMMDRLQNLFAHQTRQQDLLFAVLFVDLDHFKKVNDTLGHLIGDKLLIAVGDRIKASTRPGDTVSRFSGDEFIVIVDGLKHPDDAVAAAGRIQAGFGEVFSIDGNELFATVSIGIALSGQQVSLPEDLLRNADLAMYNAKSSGRSSFAVYDESMHSGVMESVRLENDLRAAIRNEELVVHYQPIMDSATGTVYGFEALVRWPHPTRGMLFPGTFIPVAEETGMITSLGEWVIKKACRQVGSWREQHPASRGLFVSVNVSPKQFNERFPDYIRGILEELALPADALRIEITESLLMEHSVAAYEILTALRAMGVMVYLDDFGTGYSSLNYLHKFPISALKIDRTFVMNIVQDLQAQEIIKAIAMLAKSLNLAIIVEGVEESGQLDFFRRLQCNLIQGFLYSRAVEPATAERFITGTAVH